MVLGNTGYKLVTGPNGVWNYNFGHGWKKADISCSKYCAEIFRTYRNTRLSEEEKKAVFDENRDKIFEAQGSQSQDWHENPNIASGPADKIKIARKLMLFFEEFSFEPNFRFVNTLARMTKVSHKRAKEYVISYFSLADSVYTKSVEAKMEKQEFDDILKDIDTLELENQINKRFKLYYGSQGTGKTVKATEESVVVIPCHSAVLPQDLMEDFDFVEGNAVFRPSALQIAMTEGQKACLDEINLLPFDSLRFLQSILDGKESFTYKGKEIKIADGFQIIGTMNLVVNGVVYSLPEPLIDRAEELVEFKLTASDLANAL